jgi:hypothetical protein
MLSRILVFWITILSIFIRYSVSICFNYKIERKIISAGVLVETVARAIIRIDERFAKIAPSRIHPREDGGEPRDSTG